MSADDPARSRCSWRPGRLAAADRLRLRRLRAAAARRHRRRRRPDHGHRRVPRRARPGAASRRSRSTTSASARSTDIEPRRLRTPTSRSQLRDDTEAARQRDRRDPPDQPARREVRLARRRPRAAPATSRSATATSIPLERTGRNPEVEEVLGALSLLLNGGGVAQLKTIASELNMALDGPRGRRPLGARPDRRPS